MVIGNKDALVRFSFVRIFEPFLNKLSGAEEYSIQILIDKKHTGVVSQVVKSIEEAATKGAEKGLYSKVMLKSPDFRRALRDGDQFAAEVEDGSRECYKGHVFFNAKSSLEYPPSVVDNYGRAIIDKTQVYAGCYGLVDVNFYGFKHGKGGVAAGLTSIMKRAEGERLDGRQTTEQAYKDVVDKEDAASELE